MYSAVVFFFKQKQAYELRISDWSSDVCSSDLNFDRDRSTQTTSVVIPGRIIPWSDCRLCPPHSHIHNRSGRCFKSMSKLGQTNSSSKDPQSRNKENSLLRLFPLKRRRASTGG